LLLARGPSLNGLLAHEAEFFEDALFDFIGFAGITSGILDDIQEGVKFGLEFRVAL